MAKAKKRSVPVSKRALLQRINHALSEEVRQGILTAFRCCVVKENQERSGDSKSRSVLDGGC
jgi:hypothetical protein